MGRAPRAPETLLAEDYLARARDAGRTLGFTRFALIEADERKPEKFVTLAREGFAVALDERGKPWSSTAFAKELAVWRDQGVAQLRFLIGAADGLPAEAKEAAAATIAFGPQTWPHLLVRPMLAEQLYRAMTILAGHPYHRA